VGLQGLCISCADNYMADLPDSQPSRTLYSCESACAITGSMILHTHNTLISDSPPVRPYGRIFRKFSP